jgi:Xaa-Pro aminopeptidase
MAGYFSHGTGHGVGLDVHEAPRLASGREEILQAGMVVTVEPGVYIPGVWGIRIEDTVLVKQEGYEILTRTSKELAVIEH